MLTENYAFVTRSSVIPVMVVSELSQAVPMARALLAGGISTLEITLRSTCAIDAIRAIAAEVEGVDIGAGTVCNALQLQQAVSAGAGFIVSPGSSPELFGSARELDVPLLPGAVTASEVMQVQEAGFPVAKFFPASTSGGAAAIKAFYGPFKDMLFVPTGGVGLGNVAEYLKLPNVPAVGGSWVLPPDTVAREDWATVTRLAREAVDLAATLSR